MLQEGYHDRRRQAASNLRPGEKMAAAIKQTEAGKVIDPEKARRMAEVERNLRRSNPGLSGKDLEDNSEVNNAGRRYDQGQEITNATDEELDMMIKKGITARRDSAFIAHAKSEQEARRISKEIKGRMSA